MLAIFLTLVTVLVHYQKSEEKHNLLNIGQSVSYSVQQHINITEGILTSLAYNYDIDHNIGKHKFNMLAAKYMEEDPDILFIQHKDKDTVTDMVYPETYGYTIGASLWGRPEVEEAVNKAIQNRITTANDPFILKGTKGLLGLVIRAPLYQDNQFNGFFVVVFDLKSYIAKVMEEVIPSSYRIGIYDKKGGLIWANSEGRGRDFYTGKIPIMDNYWIMRLSKAESHINTNEIMIILISFFILLLMGILIYMQAGLLKKEKNIQNLTNLHKEQKRLKESYALALDSANDALWEWNLATDEIITSDKWIEITGNALVGHGLSAILQQESIHREDYQPVLKAFEMCLEGTLQEFHREYRIKKNDESYTWVQNRGKVYFDRAGIPSKIAGAVSNIEERKQRESQMEFMAYYDVLTGLPNKVNFMITLEDSLRTMDVTCDRYSILMIDLDNFKIHNDLLGLDFCDQLLQQVSSRLYEVLGQENVLARFGGDEFLILVRNYKDIKEVERLCRCIIHIFDLPFVLMQKSVYVSVSIGMVYCFEAGQTANDVLRNADTALNKAKESGKNQYCIYDAQMHDEIIRKSNVEACIREALAKDAFIIYYQPQQDLSDNEIRGVEALARLYSDELGMISPLEFIAVAEYTGLINPLGSWILKNACVQGKDWIDRGYSIGKLSVNISVNQLHNENFYDYVKQVLEETHFPVNQLELEITESVLLEFSDNNLKVLKKLKALGISIALDDFGTGYSSFNYLTVLPIDILKIDKSFLGKALQRQTEKRVIRSIIELAHELDLKVVCEGVETAEQKQFLEEMGCDYIQGYYFSKPCDGESVENRFKRKG